MLDTKTINSVVKKIEYNGRKSYEDVSKEVSIELSTDINVETVNEIMQYLFQSKKIFGFSCVTDPRAFGLYPVDIWVKGDEDYNLIREELIKHAPSWGNIQDVRSLFGENNFWIRMHTDSILEANNDINNIISRVDYFSPTTTIETEIYRKYGFNFNMPISPIFEYKPDDVDNQILSLLKQNCRKSNKEIADKLNIDPDEVSHKIKTMEDNSIILGYTLLINQIEWNIPGAIVEIYLGKKGVYESVIEKLMNYPINQIRGIYSALGGGGHITIECFHDSIKELSKFIDEINAINGVRNTKSHIIAEFMHKDTTLK